MFTPLDAKPTLAGADLPSQTGPNTAFVANSGFQYTAPDSANFVKYFFSRA
jgi:hypothetical protein